jgi:hypothetical protein
MDPVGRAQRGSQRRRRLAPKSRVGGRRGETVFFRDVSPVERGLRLAGAGDFCSYRGTLCSASPRSFPGPGC